MLPVTYPGCHSLLSQLATLPPRTVRPSWSLLRGWGVAGVPRAGSAPHRVYAAWNPYWWVCISFWAVTPLPASTRGQAQSRDIVGSESCCFGCTVWCSPAMGPVPSVPHCPASQAVHAPREWLPGWSLLLLVKHFELPLCGGNLVAGVGKSSKAESWNTVLNGPQRWVSTKKMTCGQWWMSATLISQSRVWKQFVTDAQPRQALLMLHQEKGLLGDLLHKESFWRMQREKSWALLEAGSSS